nr:MAG TPA: hypothetical protein [Caudoviricetes sp.]
MQIRGVFSCLFCKSLRNGSICAQKSADDNLYHPHLKSAPNRPKMGKNRIYPLCR